MDSSNILGDTSSQAVVSKSTSWFANLLPWGIGGVLIAGLTYAAGSEEKLISKIESIPAIGKAAKYISETASVVGDFISSGLNKGLAYVFGEDFVKSDGEEKAAGSDDSNKKDLSDDVKAKAAAAASKDVKLASDGSNNSLPKGKGPKIAGVEA